MANLDKLIVGDHRDPRVELGELFPSEGGDALQGAREWGLSVIDAAGVSPHDQLRVIKALRDADPRLSLKPATFLAERLAG